MKPSTAHQTKLTTEALKGLAILIVILAHYAQYFASDYYGRWLRGYGFGVVAIFFVLAGFGSFYSLEKRWGQTNKSKTVLAYYFSRAVRIYPFYWVALLFTPFYLQQYGFLHSIDLHSIAVYLGLPFVNGPGVFWFVPAIIQCYLLAPLLYSLLSKAKAKKYLAINLAIVPLLLPVTVFYLSRFESTIDDPFLNIFFYKNFFLTNVVLFSLGIVIVPLVSQLKFRIGNRAFLFPAFALFALMLYLTRGSYSFLDQQHDLVLISLIPLFILSCFALCLILIASNTTVPFSSILRHPGRDSYQLYLFHLIFIAFLARISLIKSNDLLSFIIFLVCLPLFALLIRGVVYSLGSLRGIPAEE